MANLKIFTNIDFGDIHVINWEGEIYFVAKEVSSILGYAKNAKMLERLDEDEKIHMKKDEILSHFHGDLEVGNRGTYIITESGLYNAILGSKKNGAKKFKRWITHDVLPSIRKEGVYISDDATREQKLFNYKMLEETFSNCSIEKVEQLYNECIQYYKENKIRLPYMKRSDNRRKDKKHSVANSRIMVMKKIKKVLEEREYEYKKKFKFNFVSEIADVLKTIGEDIRKIQHHKTRGKLAQRKKTG